MDNSIPVLLIAFNRPSMVAGAVDNLREIKPRKIFYSSDGPRNERPDDKFNIDLCLSEVKKIDWECEVVTLLAEKNFGPGFWPQQSISWALETSEKILVLEHDVRISRDFYKFAIELSVELEHDKDVFAICAFNIWDSKEVSQHYEFYYSKYFSGWGWVTWADRWKDYEFDISKKKPLSLLDMLKINNFNILISLYYKYYLTKVMKKKLQTWDFQINYLMFKRNLKVIKFFQNLAINVGSGPEATNTRVLPKMSLQECPGSKLIKPLTSGVDSSIERRWRNFMVKYIGKSIFARLRK
jgi:hypothetical protein